MKNIDDKSNNQRTNIPVRERALVLQGGGSLGAYEAGAYQALSAYVAEKMKRREKGESQLLILLQEHLLVR